MQRFFTGFLLLIFPSLACAQDTISSTEQAIHQVRPPVELSKVVVDLPIGTPFGTAKGGRLCISSDKFLWQSGEAPKLETSLFEEAFRQDIKTLGFRGTQDGSDLFAGSRKGESNYIVAGRIEKMDLNLCYPMIGLGNEQISKGQAFIEITWQIYSRTEDKVVASYTVKGIAASKKSQPGGPHTILLGAFADTIRQFVEQPTFRSIYGASSVNK